MTWDYKQFDPLRTKDEYTNSFTAAQEAYAPYKTAQAGINQQLKNPSSYLPTIDQVNAGYAGQPTNWSVLPDGYSQFDQTYGANLDLPTSTVTGSNTPPVPDEAAYNRNVSQLETNKGIQQSAYNKMTGGGYTGGVLPNNMAETFASGGQFKGAPQSGVRPNNPFSQAQGPSYGAPGTGAAGVYGQAGSQGAGTYGAPMGGIENSNPIGGFGGPFSRINPYA